MTDPTAALTLAGLTPDPFQVDLMQSTSDRILLLASRQAGKSQTAACLAAHAAITAGALVLLLSPSQRQSTELFRKVVDVMNALGWPVPPTAESITRCELANGARIVSLPGEPGTTRCYSAVDLLIIDEAAQGGEEMDNLYRTVRPMLAVSKGRLFALTSAWGKSGWFYEAWVSGDPSWARFRVTADMVTRIGADFLASEREALGERVFRREYFCEFEDTVGGVFCEADIRRAFENGKGIQAIEI
ncbi:MAG: terminase family protein [Gemmataceae bacterium]